jgi:hypothetical protein
MMMAAWRNVVLGWLVERVNPDVAALVRARWLTP